jgi:PIN domain nuclease of toxin-antitoxin system
VKLLLDTHLLVWAAARPDRLSRVALELIENPENAPMFSAVSLWEISIKFGLGREDFTSDPRLLRRELRDHGYEEVPVTSSHALAVLDLPRLHKDPFDRILIAQSVVEDVVLLTADPIMARYKGLVRQV